MTLYVPQPETEKSMGRQIYKIQADRTRPECSDLQILGVFSNEYRPAARTNWDQSLKIKRREAGSAFYRHFHWLPEDINQTESSFLASQTTLPGSPPNTGLSSKRLVELSLAEQMERLRRYLAEPVAQANRAAVGYLDTIVGVDVAEQIETWNHLKKALDEDRLSCRKLFAHQE